MFLFELLSIVFAFILAFFRIVNKQHTKKIEIIFFIGMILSVLLHFILDGFDIIMVPGYLMILITLLFSVLNFMKHKEKGRVSIRVIAACITMIWFAACLIVLNLFPKFTLPTPSGNFGIGTASIELVDKSREETYTKDTGNFRKVMIQIWYPAKKSSLDHYESYPDEVGNAIQSVLQLPNWLFKYFSKIPTHTVLDAKIWDTSSKYPIILYSPGTESTRFQNMVVVEELVSNGYIVVGVDHPYTSYNVVFKDGTVAESDNAVTSSSNDESFYEYEIDIRTRDIIYVLNELEHNNTVDAIVKLKNNFNFDKIGVIGHSYGGATVTEMLARDKRVTAGLSLDGGLWGTVVKQGITQPFMYINASKTLELLYDQNKENREFASTVIQNLSSVYEKRSNDFYYLQMDGYDHYSFTDSSLISPLFKSGEQPIETTTVCVKAYFDKYLKGKNISLEELLKDYDYINFQQNSNIVFPK